MKSANDIRDVDLCDIPLEQQVQNFVINRKYLTEKEEYVCEFER